MTVTGNVINERNVLAEGKYLILLEPLWCQQFGFILCGSDIIVEAKRESLLNESDVV